MDSGINVSVNYPQNLWKGKRVLVTGHTGFKGSWLAIWLKELGAEVLGVALEPADKSTNFCVTKLDSQIKSVYLDLRNYSRLSYIFAQFQPEVVFHLAAQALVGISYEKPRDTFETNVVGTLNILEAIRNTDSVRAGVIITSDKCYQNVEQIWGYREHDRLGGDDPYSASKAAAEMVIKGYQKSFFSPEKGSKRIASVRAGNVIGGGDWSAFRLVPDCYKALMSNQPIIIRNPHATRPWQFVLEPLRGYIITAEKLLEQKPLSSNFNFGPSLDKAYSVSEVAQEIVKQWGSGQLVIENQNLFHECSLLQLDCTRAKAELGWAPTLKFEEHIKFTSDWYKKLSSGLGVDMYAFCASQIKEYTKLAQERD